MGNNMGVESCIQTTLDGTVIIDIEVQPGSSRQGVVGCNEWRGKLQVAVKAEAQKGKANHAVCNVLEKIFSGGRLLHKPATRGGRPGLLYVFPP